MEKINDLLHQLGISKVKLAKYLGVSRQMVYNYLDGDDINKWPKEKKMRLFQLLNIKSYEEIENIKIDTDYLNGVDNRINQSTKKVGDSDLFSGIKEIKKNEQEVLNDLFYIIKEKLINDKTGQTYHICKYLHHFMQSIDNSKELKYILAYISKSTGFTNPNEYVFNEDQQFIFESILYSAMSLYNNGGASKSKLIECHKRFEREIENKREEKLSRTQEINTAKTQALRELGYSEINEENASEVLAKIVEIQSRTVIPSNSILE